MKLEVGMYVRTLYGVGRLIHHYGDIFLKDSDRWKTDNPNMVEVDTLNPTNNIRFKIVKASHNLIDLIEEGDYVNGYLVIEKPYNYQNVDFVSLDTRDSWRWGKGEMPCSDIKTIVTREQFEAMEYRIGE